jgi:phosphatidylserine/phosphatidylglycerophosphate/cardiolipin synthase-like enzyme
MRDEEEFVLFRDLLNAKARGVRVRVLTNKFDGVRECAGTVSVLTYMSRAFEVRTYATTTFQHAKVLIADRNVTSVSSVNWSKTSYLENREAGVVIHDVGVAEFASDVFEYDWAVADAWTPPPTPGISRDDDDMMKNANKSTLTPFAVPRRNISEPHYEPPLVNFGEPMSVPGSRVRVSVSPDCAARTVMDAMLQANSTLDVYTYQLTDPLFASILSKLITKTPGVRVRFLMSRAVFGDEDREQSIRIVDALQRAVAGNHHAVEFRSSPHFYRYAHLKIMIVNADDTNENSLVILQTGNLSPSDLPFPVVPFVPFGRLGWRSINRGFQIIIRDDAVAKYFANLFNGDYQYAACYKPPSKF